MSDVKVAEKEPKLGLKQAWTEICKEHKGLLIAMIGLVILSAVMLILSLSAVRPQSTVVIVGYGDAYGELAGLSGGYRRESWLNMLAFPVLAVVFGVLHNLITLRVYRKYGRDTALVVVIATMLMIVGALVVMFRLMGEW